MFYSLPNVLFASFLDKLNTGVNQNSRLVAGLLPLFIVK